MKIRVSDSTVLTNRNINKKHGMRCVLSFRWREVDRVLASDGLAIIVSPRVALITHHILIVSVCNIKHDRRHIE